jgi:hypothetical protein
MYDENAYRQTYTDINPLQCVFERGMLRRCLGCSHCIRRNIAEREAVGCRDKAAHDMCGCFKEQLKHAAAFALKLTHPDDPLPHAKELKLQCGGLVGLECVLVDAELDAVSDVAGVLNAAVTKYGSLEGLPYNDLIQSIRLFEPRPRR